jgi:hydroxypyruvate isomerase
MERFKAAKEAGFDAVEVLFPYDCPAQDMRDQLVWNGLSFVLMNCPPPNATGGGPKGSPPYRALMTASAATLTGRCATLRF